MRRSITALFLATLTGGLMTGQDAPTYLDQFIAKVKPEKRAEFDAISKKMAALNRRNKGDTWLASENMYGENNVVTFVSLRSGFGDIQKGFDLFMGALTKPVTLTAMATTKKFDTTISADSGDLWADVTLGTNTFNPLILGSGEAGTITLSIKPSAGEVGKTVSGFIYIDTFNPTVGTGDEVVRIPYAYTVEK